MLNKIIKSKYLHRLDNIKQWQEMDVFKEESVSQHSYKDAVFARVLLEDVFGHSIDPKVLLFKLDVVSRAIFHDWDEALILRDMSHETKYNDYNGEEVRRVLDNLSKHIALREFKETDEHGTDTDASNMMLSMVCACPEPEKKFAKLCDWVALYFYMKRERSLGNRGLDEQWERAKQNFPKAVDAVINSLKINFPDVEINITELYNLKNLFNDE